MGQIFDRITNILRSRLADDRQPSAWADHMLSADDDELRRIIDELSSDGTPPPPPRSEPPPRTVPPDVERAHTTLGVAVGADVATIKKAYRSAIARWHPDRFANAPADEHARAQARAREINTAYITLKNHYRFA
jgi:DnaJ-domain-containing protein 1